ncbi:MAG: hypothetical protein CVU47_01255 [Chloroflexi bacterium HGW-Chloroflexi-9]|nr:MAG: hypothetical protein CVU47_01255 [Chloroflexi bacterium HGW-Chloroflexi-9]
MFQGNVLSEVEGDVVHMDGDFHGAHCGDTWFLLHSTQFEALFGFAHLYEARTRDSLREIAAGLPFDDEDQLVEGMSGYVRLRRGIEEARRGGLFRRVNATQLKGFAEDEGLPVAFKKVGRGWQIVVPTDSQGRAALVRLLRDAFVESKLSQIKYVADSKRLRD